MHIHKTRGFRLLPFQMALMQTGSPLRPISCSSHSAVTADWDVSSRTIFRRSDTTVILHQDHTGVQEKAFDPLGGKVQKRIVYFLEFHIWYKYLIELKAITFYWFYPANVIYNVLYLIITWRIQLLVTALICLFISTRLNINFKIFSPVNPGLVTIMHL